MCITVHATLLSGRMVRLQISPESTVNDLRQLAQERLGVGIGRLCTEKGDLPATGTAVLCAEQVVTCTVRRLQIVSSWESLVSLRSWPFFQDVSSPEAFAAVLPTGGVVTWGFGLAGGDSAEVQGRLSDVQDVQASAGAFAALRFDGRVVTWGDAAYGGDSGGVQEHLCLGLCQ